MFSLLAAIHGSFITAMGLLNGKPDLVQTGVIIAWMAILFAELNKKIKE